jgi:hypothetical protein
MQIHGISALCDARKFEAGRKDIPRILEGIEIPAEIEQIALFGLSSKSNTPTLAGGKGWLVSDLLQQITAVLRHGCVEKGAVSEQLPLLRTIQFVCQHNQSLFGPGA